MNRVGEKLLDPRQVTVSVFISVLVLTVGKLLQKDQSLEGTEVFICSVLDHTT